MDISCLLNTNEEPTSGLDLLAQQADVVLRSPLKRKEMDSDEPNEESPTKRTKVRAGLLTTQQELQVVDWVTKKNENGLFPTRKEVINLADSLLQAETDTYDSKGKRKSPLDHAWCLRFQNRHPQLKLQTSSSKGKYFDETEEEEIVQWIRAKNQQNIIPFSQEVIDFAMQIAYRKDSHKLRLSSSWVCLFANRHKGIQIKLITTECVTENTRRHITSAEEEELVRWVREHNLVGEYPTKRQVTDKAYEMAKKRNPRLMPFSRWWVNRFITLHPELKFKINGKV